MSNLLKLLGLTLMMSFLFASCSKDDTTTTETKEEAIESYAEFNINSRSITTDAVAWYCNENDKELLSVSNKASLLGLELNSDDMVDGDYTFILTSDPVDGSFTIGSVFFSATSLGLDFDLIASEVGTEIEVTSNDGAVVAGTMSGSFIQFDNDLNPVGLLPYSVTFSADIIDSSTFCD